MRLVKIGQVFYFDYRDDRGRHTKAIHRYFKIPHPITDKRSAEQLLVRAVTDYVQLAAGLKEKQVNLRWLLMEWLRAGSRHWTVRTSQSYYQRIRVFLTWTDGLKIQSSGQVTSHILGQFILDKNLQPATANRYIRAILSAFNWAVQQELLSQTPVRKFKLYPEERGKIKKVFSQKELQKLFGSARPFSDLLQITYYCLLRRSEVFFLTWADIDFKRRTLTIQSKAGFRPKSGKARIVPLNESALEILKRLKHSVKNEKVFPWWTVDAVSHKFIKLCKRLSIKGRLHDLRHTAASHLAEAGVSMKAVQNLLGHSDIKTTLEIYTHITDDYLRQAVEKFYSNFTPSQGSNRGEWAGIGRNRVSAGNPHKPLSAKLIA